MNNKETIYAEDVNYWKTSKKTSADGWIGKAQIEIENLGGSVYEQGYAMRDGKSAFVLAFKLEGDTFRLIWPVLQPNTFGEEKSAKIQAATAIYYEVKSTCVKAKFLGYRTAFIGYLMIDDGRTVSQLNNEEFQEKIPEAYKANVLSLPVGKGEKQLNK